MEVARTYEMNDGDEMYPVQGDTSRPGGSCVGCGYLVGTVSRNGHCGRIGGVSGCATNHPLGLQGIWVRGMRGLIEHTAAKAEEGKHEPAGDV